MNLHQDMDREQMRMAILNQEQIFRHQVLTDGTFQLSAVCISQNALDYLCISTRRGHHNFSPLSAFLLNQPINQVHELHQLYHVQKQLMQRAQRTALASHGPVVVDVKPRQQLDIWCSEKATTNPQLHIISFTSCNKATAPAPASALAEECDLELTLAMGPSSSSSNSSCDAERKQGKRFKVSSNCDSGLTAVSSTSTDSEMAQFREVDMAKPARFHGEVCRRMDEMGQGPWMCQCLSLKMA
jgi:hypothetical protein